METGWQKIIRYDSEDLVSDEKILQGHLPEEDGGDAVMFCDLSDVLWKMSFWQENMKRVYPYFAVKCNYDPLLLQTLARIGAGFDCASKAEIQMVQQFNARIIYAQPVKFVPHLKFAQENGVDLVTYDRRSELEKIRKYFPTARLVIRIRYDAKDVLFKMGDKFGCDPLEGPELLRAAKEMNLNVVGTSFHVGTGCNDIESYRSALHECKKLMDYGVELGYEMTIVDIGGGFHGTRENNFRDIARVINGALDDFFPDPNLHVMAEPGQFFTTSAFTLFATVQASRFVDSLGCQEYIINEGVYNTFRSVPEILKFLKIEAVKRKDGRNRDNVEVKSIILGQCPDERDFITGDAMLPVLEPGDIISFRNMGSYSISMKSGYGKFIDHPVMKYFIKSCDAERIELDPQGFKCSYIEG